MAIVKISSKGDFPWIRQFPTINPLFKDIEFVINQDIDECDCWIVYDGLEKEESVFCYPDKTILFTGEPSTVRTYNKEFIQQFNTLVTSQRRLSHKNKTYSQPCLPWFAGLKYDKIAKRFITHDYLTYNDFSKINFNNKTKLLSVITSNKTLSKGHKKRLDFVLYLKSILGDNLEIFGNGFNDIEDKLDVLKDFKYTVVIENSQHPDYWTEKLADAYLCECYPIYYGCSNIYDYFDKSSLSVIDMDNFKLAGDTIKNIIEKDIYKEHQQSILKSKHLILNEYNLFWNVLRYLSATSSVEKTIIRIKPESQNLIDKLKSRFNRIK